MNTIRQAAIEDVVIGGSDNALKATWDAAYEASEMSAVPAEVPVVASTAALVDTPVAFACAVECVVPVQPVVTYEKTSALGGLVSADFGDDAAVMEYSLDNSTWQTYSEPVAVDVNQTVYFRGTSDSGMVSEIASYTVENLGAAVKIETKADINGNGISDVMFQWTGNNYAIGYWLDGTSEWQCAGVGHPAEWEVLGSYDMNQDGLADSVLVGNVVVSGVKGAYIGYYNKSNDLDANWVNIGYLNNGEDVTWKNKVGNLTGNEGCNSLVWFAPDFGALGVWKDGQEDWATVAGGLVNYTLVGCGDFNGDGADSVVMSYYGLVYYSYDIDGTCTELGTPGDSNWEVRAIGDFAGDGKDDIVAFHKATGLVLKWDNGDSSQWSALGQLDANDWFVVGAGDYNNDGADDLLVRQYSTGMLGYYVSADMDQWVELGRGVDMNWTVIA